MGKQSGLYKGTEYYMSFDEFLKNPASVNKELVTKIIMPEGMTIIPEGLFADFTSIGSITIPKGIVEIKDNAFARCKYLHEVNLPNTLVKMGNYIFTDCKNLKNLELPNSLQEIGLKTFVNSTLSYLQAPLSMRHFSNVLYDDLFAIDAYGDKESILFLLSSLNQDDITIEDGLVDIQDIEDKDRISFNNVFEQKNIKLRYLELPTSIDNIPKEIVKFDKYKIENEALKNRYMLNTLYLDNNTVSIGENALSNCYTLQNIYGLENIEEIEKQAFSNCRNLEVADIGNAKYLGKEIFINCVQLKTAFLNNTIKSIPSGMFMNCFHLNHIDLPEELKEIQANAFSGCSALTEIRFPDSVNSIKSGALENCISLKKVKFSEGLTDLGTNCFKNCPNIEEIELPANCKLNIFKFIEVNELNNVNKITIVGDMASIDKYKNKITNYINTNIEIEYKDKEDSLDNLITKYANDSQTTDDKERPNFNPKFNSFIK